MSSIATDLAHLLEGVLRSGDYCTSGDCEILPPGLEVEGVGPIALPLLPGQAERLIAAADRAPYGRGGQTLVDMQVRRSWQIDADRVRFRGRRWSESLAGIVARVAEGLGVSDPIEAELYKLLVYDEGAFFVPHRDTEKAPGMFATLVIVLPCQYAGGALVVRHKDRETLIDLRRTDPGDVAFAAFYADCPHEILPVTSGVKLTLIYNLSRAGAGAAPKPPSYGVEQDELTYRLREWARGEENDEDDAHSPDKLIYPLEHAYTEESLSFGTLKGADAARAATLTAAARAADCDLHLALLCIEESGSAEYLGDYRSYRRRRHGDDLDDSGSFEIGEVFERTETLSGWRRVDDDVPGLGDLPVNALEVSPPDALEDMVPDAQSFQEAAGNEGASFERSYRKAALVLWPFDRRLAVINQGGLAATLPFLATLASQWTQSRQDRNAPPWRQAHELAGHMLATWPRDRWRLKETSRHVAAMLTTLITLGDAERIDGVLAKVTAMGACAKGDNGVVLAALRQLSKTRAAELIQAVVAGNALADLDVCADLLVRATALVEPDDLVALAAAASVLIEALPGDPARAAAAPPNHRPREMEPGVVVDVLSALDRIDSALSAAAIDTVLAWPKVYGLDSVIVPASLVLCRTGRPPTAAVARLNAAARDHLRARIALALAPPDTWKRASLVGCVCAHCGALRGFLADPIQSIWLFKAVQHDRSHVESEIRRGNCDLDVTTLRKGSPHVLVCAKNQASYERRAKERERDLEALAKLEAESDPGPD